MPLSAHVSTASGQKTPVAEGSRLVFGRGPGVDLIVAAGRGLSRRAGLLTAMASGVWIANISRTHALYVEGEGYQVRLPRMEDDSEPANGWFVHAGTAMVGSRAMLDEGRSLAVTELAYEGLTHAGPAEPEHAEAEPAAGPARDGDGTLLPFYLDPMTKLFLVALIWCRPWLIDPSATRPLPRTPEIARADPEYRDLLSARVAEHIKVLRRKIADRGLAAADVRLSDEVAVRILIEHGIITSADLSRLDDPAWRSRQEDLWWTQG